MKLKLDDKGNVVVVDGKPVYIHDDGQEIPFDAEAAVRKISNLSEEKTRHYNNFKEASAKLELFGDLDPEQVNAKLKEFEDLDPAEARKALETVANLKDGDLVKAGQVETLKAEMHKAFVEKESEINKSWEKKIGQLNDVLKSKDETIYELMVNSRFASSPTIADKTILPSDIAANYFSKNFKVEGEGTDARVVGYLDGERIFSKERPGEIADFEEALGVIIDAYPMKDRIMRAASGGSGAGGNTATSQNDRREQLSKLSATERLKMIHRTQANM